MPGLWVHCAISKARTDFDFKELHQWIDFPQKDFGSDHRIFRHAFNREDEATIREYWERKKGGGWGDKAVVEWLFHIAIDNLSTAFKKAKSVYRYKTFNFFKFGLPKRNNYLFFDFKPLSDDKLLQEFGNLYHEDSGDDETF